MGLTTILIAGMWGFIAVYLVIMIRDFISHRDELDKSCLKYNVLVSLVANFFDTLGIGSFAIATAAWKFRKSMSDDLIPGTLNAAFAIPMCLEATIFLKKVEVAPLTLILMIGASMIGSVAGAKIVSRLDIGKIRTFMGAALLIVVVITLCKINAVGPFGLIGTARGLYGIKLVIAVIVSLIFGGLMTIGIGFYAPCMALVLILGMSADVAYPIMMGASGYMCLACGITFIREGRYQRAASLPMVASGCIGVAIAGTIVTNLPIKVITYLVCVVMVVCSCMFFKDARKGKRAAGESETTKQTAGELEEA